MRSALQFVEDARKALGQGIVYGLGRGLTGADAPLPGQPTTIADLMALIPPQKIGKALQDAKALHLDLTDPQRKLPACDCANFVCWALRIPNTSALPPYAGRGGEAGPVYTRTMYSDANGPGSLFERTDEPLVGGLVLYPPSEFHGRRVPGHVGIITAVVDGVVTQVLHCAASNSGGFDAIQETEPEVFYDAALRPATADETITVRCVDIDYGPTGGG